MSCRRHPIHTPKGVPYSISHLLAESDEFELCEWYWKGKDELNKLNLNTATDVELLELGLSRNKVATILITRATRGGFRSVADLLKVRGIGKGTYEKIAGRLYVEEPKPEPAVDEQQKEWMLRISDATEWITNFLREKFPGTWCKLRFEHVDAAAYWYTFELVNDDRRQTWCVRHSDLK
jgi:competence ComEA-like helix-hairpin-helix protein